MDIVSESRLLQVHPALAGKIRQIATAFADLRVTQGLRSFADQQALWLHGREGNPGPVVTNAQPGYSWHEFGLAVDLCPFVDDQPDWNLSHPVWSQLIQAGEAAGLVSGSCWHQKDNPHFQLTGVFPVSPTDQVRQLFHQGGLPAVWQAASIVGPL